MALGEFTKQIAQQAILSATTKEPPPPAPVQAAENVAAVFLAQIHGMQKALKEDEELVVQCGSLRVMEIFAPSRQVVVLTGNDAGSGPGTTRVVAAVESLQLVCKVVKVQAGAKAARVVLITPKQKDSSA